jgi:DNA replication ATP-dependent helicase Dna2
MDFDRVLIDEASQIPEPMLVGLMVKLKHPILIGDHKQLPAVVVQNEKYSAVEDEDLASLGLKNMRNSFFERMYKLAVQNQWSHVLGQLSYQGRMHQQIMQFPAKHFYDGHLNILSTEADPSQSQQAPLQWTTKNNNENLEQQLRTKRLLFLPTAINELEPWAKLNQDEAEQTADVISCLISLYQKHGMDMNPDRIGVITPFRAQIAQIRQCLYDKALPVDLITIDTVERYQGGARDVIILSTCANNLEQIESICSLSDEGIDRKLNVAITRARDQFILIGNEELLSTTSGYQNLIQYIKEC